MHKQKRKNRSVKIINVIVVSILSITLMACGSIVSKKADKQALKVDNLEFAGEILTFSEVLPGQAESTVRMIITKGFLRIDDGPKAEDYLLFDRKTQVIYNVVAEEKNILIMGSVTDKSNKNAKQLEKQLKVPFPILWNVESQTSNALMRTDDTRAASATHYRLILNKKECYNLVTVDQGMEKPLAAIREYRQALAEQLKRNYSHQKGQECYEAITVFTPLNHLHQGFPMREWSAYGYQRFLVNHQTMIIFPQRLFELPENYSRMEF